MLIELLAVAAILDEQGGPTTTAVIVDPAWAVVPTPSWPRGASDMNIVQGEVVANCLAGVEGRLSDCRVETEKPGGYGFAREMLASASAARLDTGADDFAVGARVQFTVRFESASVAIDSRED